jgi:hypothetical protein
MILLGVDATPNMTDASTVGSVVGTLTFAPTASPLDATQKVQVQVIAVDWPTFFTNASATYTQYIPF